MTTTSVSPVRPPRRARPSRLAGAVLHLLVAVFPLSASGLVAPLWAIVVLYLAWAAIGIVFWRASRTRPAWMLLAAPALLVAWVAVLTLGDRVLGWTA